VDALAVVVNRYRKLLFCVLLPDDVLIQELLYFQRLGHLARADGRLVGLIVFENGIANPNALIANISSGVITGRGNQLADYVLALVAERAA
jgi:hypothetical protein